MNSRSAVLLVAAAAFLMPKLQGQTDSTTTISLSERIYIASRVYGTLQNYFNGWQEYKGTGLDESYQHYLHEIIQSDGRREFDLATMRFVALLHNGHTWFDDRWLKDTYGSPLGFYARPVQGEWVVTESELEDLRVGDVIADVDGRPAEQFFREKRQYLSDSSERSQRIDLFAQTYLFPQDFVIKLTDGRMVKITRKKNVSGGKSREEVTGKWTEPGRFAYIRIPAFSGVRSESATIELVQRFKGARGLVLDLRRNPGGYGNPPLELQAALMDRPFRSWRESLGRFSSPRGNRGELVAGEEWAKPDHDIKSGLYGGSLVILIDGGCASYCEDFVMPFKDNHRAILIGETTYGSYSQTYFMAFDNGMMLNTAVTRELFPNGDPFEGVGISPDIELDSTVDDIRSGNDRVLQRALEILRNVHE